MADLCTVTNAAVGSHKRITNQHPIANHRWTPNLAVDHSGTQPELDSAHNLTRRVNLTLDIPFDLVIEDHRVGC